MRLPKIIGKIVYLTGYPFIYIAMHSSVRVYAVVKVENKVLLTKNWLGLHRDWRLPGGGIKPDEDKLTALARELSEELGLTINPHKLRPVTNKACRARLGYYYYIYEINFNSKPKICVCDNEIVSAQFFDRQTINSLHLSEIAKTAKKELGWSIN